MKGQTQTMLCTLFIIALGMTGGFLIVLNAEEVLAPSGDDWTIDGNTVYIDDANVFIQAEPHTLSSSEWVYLNFTPKSYTGDIDMLWGFNTDNMKPKKAELYNPHTVEWTTDHQHDFHNVSSIVDTSNSCDYGNEYNTHKKLANYTIRNGTDNSTNTTIWDYTQSVVCFDSYATEGNDYRIYWETEHSRFEQYTDVSDRFGSLNHEFEGMNKWYYVTDVPVTAGENYMIRVFMQPKINSDGKYWVALKPSGETLSQAIASDHLYYLDPWWNSSWEYKKQINITEQDSKILTNYPFIFWFEHGGNAETNCSDIRLINSTTDTEIDFGMRNCNSTHAELVTKISCGAGETITDIYGYYGATGVPFGNSTWNDIRYNIYDDFDDNSSEWLYYQDDNTVTLDTDTDERIELGTPNDWDRTDDDVFYIEIEPTTGWELNLTYELTDTDGNEVFLIPFFTDETALSNAWDWDDIYIGITVYTFQGTNKNERSIKYYNGTGAETFTDGDCASPYVEGRTYYMNYEKDGNDIFFGDYDDSTHTSKYGCDVDEDDIIHTDTYYDRLGFVGRADGTSTSRIKDGWIDDLHYHQKAETEPTITLGAEETGNEAPKWSFLGVTKALPSNESTYPVTPRFRIKWTDADDDNLLVYLYHDDTQINATEENITLDTWEIYTPTLSVGYHNITWSASDGIETNSTEFTYTILKNSSTDIDLYINGSRSDHTTLNTSAINLTAVLELPNIPVTLTIERDGNPFSSGTNPLYNMSSYWPIGYYNINASWGGNENYTGDSEDWNVNITYTTTTSTTSTTSTTTAPATTTTIDYGGTTETGNGTMNIWCYDEDTEEEIEYNLTISNSTNIKTFSGYNITHENQITDNNVGDDYELAHTFNVNDDYGLFNIDKVEMWVESDDTVHTVVGKVNVTYLDGSTDEDTNAISQDVDKETFELDNKPIDQVFVWSKSENTYTHDLKIHNVTFVNDNEISLNWTQIKDNDIPTNIITLQFSAIDYDTREYYANLNNETEVNVSAYLLEESISIPITVRIYDPYDQRLEDVFIDMEKSIGGTWTTISQDYTNNIGESTFYLDDSESYRLTASKSGYADEVIEFNPSTYQYSALEIYMGVADSYVFETAWDNIRYDIEPESNVVVNQTNFSFSITDSDSSLSGFALGIYNSTDHLLGSDTNSTSASGGTVAVSVNLTGYDTGEEIEYVAYFNMSGTQYNVTKTYIVGGNIYTGAYSLWTTITNINLAQASLIFLAFLVTTLISIAFSTTQFGKVGGGLISIFILGGFVLIGWLPVVYFFISIIGVVGVLLISGR